MKKALYLLVTLLFISIGLLIKVEKEDDVVVSHDTENLKSESDDVQNENSAVKITFLDIGQGDATWIEFPDKEQMLVDCAVDNRILSALGRVMPFYDREIDYLLITHPDMDHYGGCIEVMKRYEIKNIVYTGLKKVSDPVWQAFWQAIQDEGAQYLEINQEQTWDIASTSLHFFYPDHSVVDDFNIPGATSKTVNTNDTSLVFSLTANGKSALFVGDTEVALEKYLVNKYGEQLNVDILKVGHHGSGGASSEEWLNVVSPAQAVISVGKNNRYGHPSLRVLKRLERVGSKVWRTDENSDIMIEIGNSEK